MTHTGQKLTVDAAGADEWISASDAKPGATYICAHKMFCGDYIFFNAELAYNEGGNVWLENVWLEPETQRCTIYPPEYVRPGRLPLPIASKDGGGE